MKGPFRVIDINTSEGKKLWDKLGNDPTAALAAGYDGVKHKNYEKLKIEAFYKDIDWDDVKNASEIEIFRDVNIR